MLQTVSIIVEGLVQGVFFRQSTKDKAVSFGITGEVRNMQDGTVYIIATGTGKQISQLVEWCHKGPDKANVTNVDVQEVPLQQFNSFTIARGR